MMTPEHPTAEQLRAECIAIIERIYRSRYNTKLLLAARRGLELYANYKANRARDSR